MASPEFPPRIVRTIFGPMLVAVIVSAGCEEGLMRRDLCERDCAQKFDCYPSFFQALYDSDEAACVEACVEYAPPEDCLTGMTQGCLDARRERWECVAGLSCSKLNEFWVGTVCNGWNLDGADGGVSWEAVDHGPYPCDNRDAEVLESCSAVDWTAFPTVCGYDNGDCYSNYMDEEFDDL